MATVFSSRFQITQTPVLIKKGSSAETAGDNIIPANVFPINVQIIPDKVDGVFPTFYAKAIGAAEYIKVEGGTYTSGKTFNDYRFCFIKASDGETITVNMIVDGI